jgi:hypothetical protein
VDRALNGWFTVDLWYHAVQLVGSAQSAYNFSLSEFLLLAMGIRVLDHERIVLRFDHLVDDSFDGRVRKEHRLCHLRKAVQDCLLVSDKKFPVMGRPQLR